MKIQKILISFLTVAVLACSDEKSLEDSMNETVAEDTTNTVVEISQEVFEEIIRGIPSPLEISSLIKESGADYSEELINPSSNLDNYSTNYKRALNLGVYGADLGYINLYDQTSNTISHLNSIRILTGDLRVGQFFDFMTIKDLASNSDDIVELLNITTSSFEAMNDYLAKQKRGDIGVLILTGGWLEALNLAIQIALVNDDKALIERIGEQKIILDEIILLLSVYQKDSNIKDLYTDFQSLKSLYDQVNIVYTYGEPEMVEIDGMLQIVDNSSSEVQMTKEQFHNIAKLTKDIRTKIIS